MALNRCVHCLRENIATTKDHLFPKSWLPSKSLASPFSGITFPSCERCNNQYSKYEEYLLRMLVYQLSTTDHIELMTKIATSELGFMAKNERDKRIREALLEKRLRESKMSPSEFSEDLCMLPHFSAEYSPNPNLRYQKIRLYDIYRMVCKFVRGALYTQYGIYLERGFNIVQELGDLCELIESEFSEGYYHQLSQSDEAVLRIQTYPARNIFALCSITIWKRWKLYATVNNDGPPEELGYFGIISPQSDYSWTNMCVPYVEFEASE